MFGFHRHNAKWVYAGSYCQEHLGDVAHMLGTMKVETLALEEVPHDRKCDNVACKERPEFAVSKQLVSAEI